MPYSTAKRAGTLYTPFHSLFTACQSPPAPPSVESTAAGQRGFSGGSYTSKALSHLAVCGSARRRVAADGTGVQTSDCSYNHRGIGSQSVGGELPSTAIVWEV